MVAVACGLALALVPSAQARIADLDPGFDGDGVALPAVGAGAARFEAVTTRPDGRPLAVGWAQVGGGLPEAIVAQLLATGAPDPGFGTAGVTRIPGGGTTASRLHGVALDGQGRVLAAGDQAAATTAPILPVLRRFTAAGAPDGVFAIGALDGEARAVHPLPNGNTLVAGWRTLAVTPLEVFFVARLLPGGALDTTFAGDGIADVAFATDARAEAMAVDAAGNIVLAGWSTEGAAGPHRPALARVTENGTVDEGFGAGGVLTPVGTDPAGGVTGELNAVAVDALGRITAAGHGGRYAYVTRRLAGGGPDPTFGTAGGTYAAVQDVAVLEGLAMDGGRAVVGGTSGVFREASALLLGAVDAAGVPEARLGGTPPGWRTFPVATQALGVALGPAGTVYTAGVLGSPASAFVARHAANAAPVAALAAPGSVVVGAPATFDAGGSSDPEGEALRFAFDLDGDGSYEFDGGQNPLALRSFPAPGTFTVGVRVTDPRGAAATATTSIAVTPAARPVPLPVLGRQGVATPKSGVVLVRLPGTRKFVPITDVSAIPDGTEIDARKGRVLLTVLHDASGRLDGAVFYAGRFIFNQGGGKVPVTTLRLSGGSFAACGSRKAKARGARSIFSVAVAASVKGGTGARAKKKPPRRLWGDGRGKFRTKGRYGAATVRGTKWLTVDRCDGTLVRVERGKVDVEDLIRPRRKVQRVRAGQKTFVPAKRK